MTAAYLVSKKAELLVCCLVDCLAMNLVESLVLMMVVC